MPRRGPVILASNHLSFADRFFGPLPLPRKMVFLAKAEYFNGRGIRGWRPRRFSAAPRHDPHVRVPALRFGPAEVPDPAGGDLRQAAGVFRFYGKESDRAVLRTVTDEIMREIQELSGREYVDVYAKQAKDQLQEPGPEPDLP
jgi:hypothetical protein